jgi:hypothetical protein
MKKVYGSEPARLLSMRMDSLAASVVKEKYMGVAAASNWVMGGRLRISSNLIEAGRGVRTPVEEVPISPQQNCRSVPLAFRSVTGSL